MTEIPEWQSRTSLLIGGAAIQKLKKSHVLIVGLGGVGAYAAEMICRAGVGELTIVDGDKINPSNRNRQLIALISTEGEYKTDLLEKRLKDINPKIIIHKITEFIVANKIDFLLQNDFDYVIDAIDTILPKVTLLSTCYQKEIPVVSSMGSGGKTDPTSVIISDISKSYNCRLAHALRKRLHRLGIRKGIKVVFSPEKIISEAVQLVDNEPNKKTTVGTLSYMPASFGIALSSVVIRDLTGE